MFTSVNTLTDTQLHTPLWPSCPARYTDSWAQQGSFQRRWREQRRRRRRRRSRRRNRGLWDSNKEQDEEKHARVNEWGDRRTAGWNQTCCLASPQSVRVCVLDVPTHAHVCLNSDRTVNYCSKKLLIWRLNCFSTIIVQAKVIKLKERGLSSEQAKTLISHKSFQSALTEPHHLSVTVACFFKSSITTPNSS